MTLTLGTGDPQSLPVTLQIVALMTLLSLAMGMMMMPPVVISLPCKILLFVLVNGWQVITESLVISFR